MKDLFNIIIVIFPILIYFIYSVSNKIVEKDEKNIFEFCIFSSIYLLISINGFNLVTSLYLNSFLLILYYKNRYLSAILLSFIIININYDNYILFIIVYLSYYLIYKYNTHYLHFFLTLLTSIIFLILGLNIEILIFIVLNYLLIKLIDKLDNIYKLYKSLSDINDDKLLIKSLFNITHEIKNPIAVCKGYLDMYDVNNIDHSRKYIPIIKEEIERTIMLLNDFLSISKLNINKDIVDINLLLDDVIKTLDMMFKSKNIKLNKNILDNEIYINGDYNRLEQVFINILKNSVEAIDNNGLIEIKNFIENNNIIISIKDNGSGIKDIEKIKEPFFTTKKNGTGLGVPLSIEIIKKHDGEINYNCNTNGTEVIIKLPINSFNN